MKKNSSIHLRARRLVMLARDAEGNTQLQPVALDG
jgi:hypothetical protein